MVCMTLYEYRYHGTVALPCVALCVFRSDELRGMYKTHTVVCSQLATGHARKNRIAIAGLWSP